MEEKKVFWIKYQLHPLLSGKCYPHKIEINENAIVKKRKERVTFAVKLIVVPIVQPRSRGSQMSPLPNTQTYSSLTHNKMQMGREL